MCIAEAGYDPQLIEPYEYPRSGFVFRSAGGLIPPEVCWQAKEVVAYAPPKCLACTMRDRHTHINIGCDADRRFVLDCGRDGGDDADHP